MAYDSEGHTQAGYRTEQPDLLLAGAVGLSAPYAYAIAGLAFVLSALAVASLGSGSFAALLFPLLIAAVGLLISARAALPVGGLSALVYAGIVFAQARGALPLSRSAERGTAQAPGIQALVGALALLVTGLVVFAGVREWERARRRNARRAERLRAAAEIGLLACTAQDLDTMLQDLVALVCERFDVQNGQVFLLDRDDRLAVLRVSTGEAGQMALARGHRVEVGSQGVIGQVTAGAGPIVVLETDAGQHEELMPEMRSELALPLALNERIVGALDVQSSRIDAFQPEDVEALQKVADQIAVAVDNTRTLASEAGVLETASPVFLAGREIAAAKDIRQVLTALRRRVVEDVDRLSVVRLDVDRADRVHPVTLAVWDRDDLAPFGIAFDDLGLDLTRDAPRLVEDTAALDDESDAMLKDVLTRLRARSFAAIPLAPNGGTILTGVLLLFRRATHHYSEQEIHTLQTLSNQIAVVVENLQMAEAIDQQSERLNVLNSLSQTLADMVQPDLDAVGREVAERVKQLVGYEHLSVSLLDNRRQTASLQVLSVDGQETAGNRVFPLEGTAIQSVVETGQTMVTLDLSGSSYKDHQAWWAEDIFGAVVTPLKSRGSVFGTLNVGFPAQVTPGPDDVAVLEQLAAQLAVALDNRSLLDRERRRHEEATALLEISEAAGTTQELEGLLRQICIRAARVCEVDRCTIFVLEQDGETLRYLMSQFGEPDEGQGTPLVGDVRVTDASIFEQALSERHTVILKDVSQEDALPRAWAESLGIARLLAVPLVSRDQNIGLMMLDYVRPEGRFSDEQVDLAEKLGSQVATSIENSRLFERVQSSMTETSTLYSASLALNSAQDVAELFETAAVQIADVSGADRVNIYLAAPGLPGQPGMLDEVVRWARGDTMSGSYRPGRRVKSADVPPFDAFPEVRSNLMLNNLAENLELAAPMRRALRLKGVRSLAVVPLIAGAAWLGAVVLEKADSGRFGDEAISLCRSLADQTALAFDAQRLLEATRREAARELALRDISARLRQAPDVESVLRVAVEELGKVLSVQEVSAQLGRMSNNGDSDSPEASE